MSFVAKQITTHDAVYSSTLHTRDVGKWYVMVQGTYQIRESKEAAQQLAADLTTDERNELKGRQDAWEKHTR